MNNKLKITIPKLAEYDLGIPTYPNMVINPKTVSYIEPQAWEYKGNWYYNWEGAMKEAEHLGKKIPSKEDWGKICKSYENDGERMSKELGLSLAGYRYWNTVDTYFDLDIQSCYWTSTSNYEYAFLMGIYGDSIGYEDNANLKLNGYSVRCLKK